MPRLTLAREIELSGVGLHSGQPCSVKLMPAPAGQGYVFAFPGGRYPIQTAGHTGDGRGTILTFGANSVMTVEHLLAALRGLGIDDVVICPRGPEVPLLDGSALGYCEAVLSAGIGENPGEPSVIRISSPVFAASDDERRFCAVFPSDRLRFTYVIEYDSATAIGTQAATVEPRAETFVEDLGQCRTFCLYEEVEQMRKMGLGLGGTVETALIVKGKEVLTPGGLRRPDEFVRHKILDMIGDLALLGQGVCGHFVGVRAGHAMHQRLVDLIARQYSGI